MKGRIVFVVFLKKKKTFLSLYVLLSAQVLYGGEGMGKGEMGVNVS